MRTRVREVYRDRVVRQVLKVLTGGDTPSVALSIKGEITVLTSYSNGVNSMG